MIDESDEGRRNIEMDESEGLDKPFLGSVHIPDLRDTKKARRD